MKSFWSFTPLLVCLLLGCSSVNEATGGNVPEDNTKLTPPISIPAPVSRDDRNEPLANPILGPATCDPRPDLYLGMGTENPILPSLPEPWAIPSGFPFETTLTVFSDGAPNLSGMQVRAALLNFQTQKTRYQDFLLVDSGEGEHFLSPFFENPETDNVVDIFYFFGIRPAAPLPDSQICNFTPTDDFTTKTASLTFEEFYSSMQANSAIFMGTFEISILP